MDGWGLKADGGRGSFCIVEADGPLDLKNREEVHRSRVHGQILGVALLPCHVRNGHDIKS